jgi:hypothetical protein
MKKLKDWNVNNCTIYCFNDDENSNHVVAYTGANADISLDWVSRCQANALLIAQAPWMFNVLKSLLDRPDAIHYLEEASDVKRIINFIEKSPLFDSLEKEEKE